MMFPDTQYKMTMNAAKTVGIFTLVAGLVIAATVALTSGRGKRRL